VAEYLVGCANLPARMPRDQYFSKLSFLETDILFSNPPRPSVLARWRAEAPEDASFAMIAPQLITHPPQGRGYPGSKVVLTPTEAGQAGHLRATDTVRRAVEGFAEASAALRASAVVFRTPPTFTPSATNRDALRAFFDGIATAERFGTTARVWEPQGLWDVRTAAVLAAEIGVLFAGDPLTVDPIAAPPELWASLPTDGVYFRLTGLGHARRRFPELELETLAETVAQYQRAWIVFSNVDAFADAKRFAPMLDGLDAAND
jgi:uncharacterized protein YecE (DUF72 family)